MPRVVGWSSSWALVLCRRGRCVRNRSDRVIATSPFAASRLWWLEVCPFEAEAAISESHGQSMVEATGVVTGRSRTIEQAGYAVRSTAVSVVGALRRG